MLRLLLTAVLAVVTITAGACGGDSGDDSPPQPSPTPEWRIVDAPIDDYELVIRESFPVQYAVRIVSGIPDGCHEFNAIETTRVAETIRIHVTNRVPDQSDLVCTEIYGLHEETTSLGTDFVGGTEYRVEINDKVLTFSAQ